MKPTNRVPLGVVASMVAALTACGTGCLGNIGGGESGGDNAIGGGAGSAAGGGNGAAAGGPLGTSPAGSDPAASGAAPTAPPASGAPGATYLRRLTQTEYVNTVKALLGLPTKGISDATVEVFDGSADSFSVSSSVVDQYLLLAEELAAAADPLRLNACDPAATGERACAQSFVASFGKRALRRPLAPAEASSYMALFDKQRAAGDDYKTSIRALLTRMLIAPSFLHHIEIGQPAGAGELPRVTPFELASRLSYLVWESMPDAALFAAAESGALARADEVARQVARLTTTEEAMPLSRAATANFYTQWLGLQAFATSYKDRKLFPTFEAARSDVLKGTLTFIEDVLRNGPGDVKALFTAPYLFANARVGALYGVTTTSTELTRFDVDPRKRAGILTQPAVMATLGKATESAPILRGALVLSRVLCSPPPPPPADVNEQVDKLAAAIPATATTREYVQALTRPAACNACHGIINPVGFGFENYNAIGAWRDTDKGAPVDATGSVSAGDVAGPFNGAAELGQKLGGSKQVASCMVRQWFRYGFRRHETAGDERIVADIQSRFAAAGGKLLALAQAVTQTDAFQRVHYTIGATK